MGSTLMPIGLYGRAREGVEEDRDTLPSQLGGFPTTPKLFHIVKPNN